MSKFPKPRRQLMFAGLWLLALLLMWGSAHAPGETVRILDGRAETVLQPAGTWTVPLVKSQAFNALADWPYWLVAIMGSLLIAGVGRRMLLQELPPAAVFVVVTGLALLMRPEHLVLAGILCLTAWLAGREMRWSRKCPALLGCLVFSLLVSLEFGFVLFVLLLLSAADLWKGSSRRSRGIAIGASAVVIGLLAWWSPGLLATAGRSVSWLWTNLPSRVLPGASPAFSHGQDWRLQSPMLVFFLFCWAGLFWNSAERGRFLPLLLFLTLLGFCNASYLWIAGVTLAATYRVPMRSEISTRIGYAVLAMSMLFGLARFVPRAGAYFNFALGEVTPRFVDPTEWGMHGRVMLLDLSQSSDWQPGKIRARFELLLDDRWEVFGDQYEAYAAVCRDIREIRADGYLRTDQKWGGYQSWLKEWTPVMLVADSSQTLDIRRLSLSPHWRILGIDARRTMFGKAKEPQIYRQSARAIGMIQQLEWPSISSPVWHENVVAANSADDLLKVSRVPCAMRFPYAALRLLPQDTAQAVRNERTLCHVEIAHRVYRHAGQGSLLDQFRGIYGLRRIIAESHADPETVLRALASIEGLGQEKLAQQLAKEIAETQAASWSAARQHRLQSLLDRTATHGQAAENSPSALNDAEAAVRQALLTGDLLAGREHLQAIEEPLQDYYALLLSSSETAADDLFEECSTLLEQANFPKPRRGEALFYLGCLALEAGDSEAALAAFRENAQVEPASPFHSLEELYRMQMGDR